MIDNEVCFDRGSYQGKFATSVIGIFKNESFLDRHIDKVHRNNIPQLDGLDHIWDEDWSESLFDIFYQPIQSEDYFLDPIQLENKEKLSRRQEELIGSYNYVYSTCPKCERTFDNDDEIDDHEKETDYAHQPNFCCRICGVEFCYSHFRDYYIKNKHG